jgi:hypothetical protein
MRDLGGLPRQDSTCDQRISSGGVVDPPDLDRGDVVVEDVRGDLVRPLKCLALDLVVGGQVLGESATSGP